MRNINYILIAVLILGSAGYFLASHKSSPQIKYTEPDSTFIDKSQVPKGAIVVHVKEDMFEPEILSVHKGDSVTWVNDTKGYVWPASDPHPTHTNYSSTAPFFDPELPMKAGQAWTFTFQKAGNWNYHDHLDPTKRGTIQVSE